MPSVKEIQLVCTPKEWEVLCVAVDSFRPDDIRSHLIEDDLQAIRDKISAINKRLMFASSYERKDN